MSATLATEAVNVLLPAVAPKVHAGAVATPLALVYTTPELAKLPPPLATVNVTVALSTATPLSSTTKTDGAVATAPPRPAV